MAWRLLLVCGLALVLVAPPAAAQSTRIKILRECSEDGRLTGDYTAQQIRDARSNIPDDIDEYTDCRDVLTRALLSRAGGGDSGGGGGGGTTGGTGGTTAAEVAAAAESCSPRRPTPTARRSTTPRARTRPRWRSPARA